MLLLTDIAGPWKLTIARMGGITFGGQATTGDLYALVGSTWVLKAHNPGYMGECHALASSDKIYGCDYDFNASQPLCVWDGFSSWIGLNMKTTYSGLNYSVGDFIIFNDEPWMIIHHFTIGSRIVKYSGGAFVTVLTSAAYIQNFALFAGSLYVQNPGGALYLISGGTLVLKAPEIYTNSLNYPLAMGFGNPTFNGELYTVNHNGVDAVRAGSLWKWDGVSAWVSLVPWAARYDGARSLQPFDGVLYISTDSNGQTIEQWDGGTAFSVSTFASYGYGDLYVLDGSLFFNRAGSDLYSAVLDIPNRASVGRQSTMKISHARIVGFHKSARDADLFHRRAREADNT